MKRFLSIVLAAITAVSLALPAFAADETTKSVDNTFDNFEPNPGKTAPNNWYDPWMYDSEGHILQDALATYVGLNAYYCQKAKKIFSCKANAVTANGNHYYPYETLIEGINPQGEATMLETDYCPYCGVVKNYKNDFFVNHIEVEGIKYGSYCTLCGKFNAQYGLDDLTKMQCKHCAKFYEPTKIYRFTSEVQRNAEYSFIFTETEYQFGDGKDGKMEDLKLNRNVDVKEWNDSSKPQKLSFWQKLINFFKSIFKNIADFFNKLFK